MGVQEERVATRDRLVDLLRAQLVGPAGAPDEILKDRPDKRYLMGMLFPQDARAENVLADEEEAGEDGRATRDGEAPVESPTDLLFQRLPASVGVSFAVDETADLRLDITVAAGLYEPAGRTWARAPAAETVDLALQVGQPVEVPVLGGRAKVFAVVRRGARTARVLTVTLVNTKKLENADDRVRPEDILYQVAMEVRPSAKVQRWPAPDRLSEDQEEDELQLRYRKHAAFAVGHGCAASWVEQEGRVVSVGVDFLPAAEVPPVTTEIDLSAYPAAAGVHRLQRLQDENVPTSDLIAGFQQLLDAYRHWRSGLDIAVDLESRLEGAKDRILARIDRAIGRIASGIELLKEDARALHCFRLANRAMMVQMAYADRVALVEQKGRRPAPAGVPSTSGEETSSRQWRPFQLAFFLMSLRGLWDTASDDRDVADLIWFPTGGGKTEAYLAAAAFEMLRRRIQLGARGAGTAVLTRYTLRLLTQQQFQRSAHLICALEDLRAVDPQLLGDEPFSLGLWIGKKSTPLSFDDARKIFLDKVVNPSGFNAKNPFALMSCPCCGTPLVPGDKEEMSDAGVGIRAMQASFEFFCPDTRCHRHRSIPVQVIDEALYRQPPTLLLATLDKFAMLAWRSEASAFFGRLGRNFRYDPPSLVIQDEMHLISGPLGTIAGLYEAALDAVIRSLGGRLKIIASTATIRRADEQSRALFSKNVEVFPPPGIDAEESFFSSRSSKPGRLYLGAMGQGHTPTYSVVMVSAALMQAVKDLKLDEAISDSWWTLVAYHNSRRELGKSLTLANDDIPARLIALFGDDARQVRLVKELSANVPGDEIPRVLDELKQEHGSGRVVDFLGCTNMLSVGVDVARLGAMLVVGQPRSTSEYIQATSRVGRDSKRLPGVVLTLLMPTKPRDRSHYESFQTFHRAMYRYVEPTSVTPYALPARRRALHAAAVIAVRHRIAELGSNDAASRIAARSTDVTEILGILVDRMISADQNEMIGIVRDLEQFMAEWRSRASTSSLRYSAGRGSINFKSLIRTFGDNADPDARETLQSMRHVDKVVRAAVWGQRQPDENEDGGGKRPRSIRQGRRA